MEEVRKLDGVSRWLCKVRAYVDGDQTGVRAIKYVAVPNSGNPQFLLGVKELGSSGSTGRCL